MEFISKLSFHMSTPANLQITNKDEPVEFDQLDALAVALNSPVINALITEAANLYLAGGNVALNSAKRSA